MYLHYIWIVGNEYSCTWSHSLLHLCPIGRVDVLHVEYLHCKYCIAAIKAKPWQARETLAPAPVHLPDLTQSTLPCPITNGVWAPTATAISGTLVPTRVHRWSVHLAVKIWLSVDCPNCSHWQVLQVNVVTCIYHKFTSTSLHINDLIHCLLIVCEN